MMIVINIITIIIKKNKQYKKEWKVARDILQRTYNFAIQESETIEEEKELISKNWRYC